MSHHTISPILEIKHLLLPRSLKKVPVDSMMSVPLKTIKLFNHSVTTNYSANSTLIVYDLDLNVIPILQ